MSMTATNHTEHYGLSQYTEDDRPTYTGDYNGDMSKIDAAIYAASQTGGVSGLTEVAHTADLTGNGTAGNPLGVADTIARTEDIPSLDGYATTESVTQAIAAAIADRLTAGDIKAGNGINIETSGNQVTISYMGGGSSGGLTAVAHDTTLTGDGTSGAPLGMAEGVMLRPAKTYYNITSIDFNEITLYGIYDIRCTGDVFNYLQKQNVYGSLFVLPLGAPEEYDVMQMFIERSASQIVRLCIRAHDPRVSATWSEWINVFATNSVPDVSALASRIAALESQVSALTATAPPSTPGLTAEALDTQYSDNYNIVRTEANKE